MSRVRSSVSLSKGIVLCSQGVIFSEKGKKGVVVLTITGIPLANGTWEAEIAICWLQVNNGFAPEYY